MPKVPLTVTFADQQYTLTKMSGATVVIDAHEVDSVHDLSVKYNSKGSAQRSRPVFVTPQGRLIRGSLSKHFNDSEQQTSPI